MFLNRLLQGVHVLNRQANGIERLNRSRYGVALQTFDVMWLFALKQSFPEHVFGEVVLEMIEEHVPELVDVHLVSDLDGTTVDC